MINILLTRNCFFAIIVTNNISYCITSVSLGGDLILTGDDSSFIVNICTLGHLLASKHAPGTKGMMSEDNYTRLHDQWFVYIDANIHTGCSQSPWFAETKYIDGHVNTQQGFNKKLLVIAQIYSFTYKLRLFKLN